MAGRLCNGEGLLERRPQWTADRSQDAYRESKCVSKLGVFSAPHLGHHQVIHFHPLPHFCMNTHPQLYRGTGNPTRTSLHLVVPRHWLKYSLIFIVIQVFWWPYLMALLKITYSVTNRACLSEPILMLLYRSGIECETNTLFEIFSVSKDRKRKSKDISHLSAPAPLLCLTK